MLSIYGNKNADQKKCVFTNKNCPIIVGFLKDNEPQLQNDALIILTTI